MMAARDSSAPTRLCSSDHTECEEVALEVDRLHFGSRESRAHGSYLPVYKTSFNYRWLIDWVGFNVPLNTL